MYIYIYIYVHNITIRIYTCSYVCTYVCMNHNTLYRAPCLYFSPQFAINMRIYASKYYT